MRVEEHGYRHRGHILQFALLFNQQSNLGINYKKVKTWPHCLVESLGSWEVLSPMCLFTSERRFQSGGGLREGEGGVPVAFSGCFP